MADKFDCLFYEFRFSELTSSSSVYIVAWLLLLVTGCEYFVESISENIIIESLLKIFTALIYLLI